MNRISTYRITKYCWLLLPILLLLTSCKEGDSSELVNSVSTQIELDNGTAIVSITLKGTDIRLRPGEQAQLYVLGTDMNNDIRDISDQVHWQSVDPTLASISDTGLVVTDSSQQGQATIKAVYRDKLSDEGDISISDIAVSEILIAFENPDQQQAYTCIETQMSARITYTDGFQEQVSDRADWQLVSDDATITTSGLFISTNAAINQQTILLSYHDAEGAKDIMISTDAISVINILDANNSANTVNLSIGSSGQLQAVASLKASISSEIINITANGYWEVENPLIAVVSNHEQYSGLVKAISAGTSTIEFSCGLKTSSNTLDISGSASIDKLQLNDGEITTSLKQTDNLDIKLWLHYKDSTTKVNLTEYANWTITPTDIADFQLKESGTDNTTFVLTPKSGQIGNITITATFAETNYNMIVTITD